MRRRTLVTIAGLVVLAIAVKVILTPASWPEPTLHTLVAPPDPVWDDRAASEAAPGTPGLSHNLGGRPG